MQASFVQKQQLGLKMSPQMYQSLKLLELPLADLREKVAEELERNPALELVEDRSTVQLGEGEGDGTRGEGGEGDDYFEATSDPGFLRVDSGAGDLIEGVLTRGETLQQSLLWQLQLEPADDTIREIAALLIQNLDDDGFHREPVESLFPGGEPPRLGEAVALVRRLDPAGCCVADFRESLRVQVSILRGDPACLECPMDHLADFEKGNFAAAKRMRCGKKDALACFALVRRLSPFPGRGVGAGDVRFVTPDVQVRRDGDGFAATLNDEDIPVLGISPFFRKLTGADRSGGAAAREFARDNVREARTFINSLAMRNRTLKAVVGALVDLQRPFFESGPRGLVPLTLGDIAQRLGVHKATVSRVANGKYVRTEWGVFELRRFFTNSISGSGSSGSSYSKEGVKAVIAELVSTESGNLSDGDISRLLAERGIPLARRTVAKYRGELDLGSSYTRQQGTAADTSRGKNER